MFIYAIFVLLPALALTQDAQQQLENKLYNALDKDGNGEVTKLENEQYFLGLDANKDTFVSKQEFSDAIDKLDAAFIGHEDKLYALLDSDSNNKVDKADIDAALNAADANKDGKISKAEFHVIFSRVVTEIGSK